MKKTMLLGGFFILSITITTAQYKNNQSAFADKPADSYSNFKDENGKPGVLIWGNAPLNDFGSRPIKFNYEGLRKLPQAPALGVHPRIYFSPNELPDIQRRLKETKCGQAAWKNIISWTEMMKGKYDDKAEYAQPDVWKGGFGGLHGRVPLFRLGIPRANGMAYNHHSMAADYYDGLANGTIQSFPEYYWNVFSLEAFRCLVENDEKAAKKLASATITALKIDQLKRDSLRNAKHITKPEEQPLGRFQLAFTYDLIFKWLNPEQKKAMHDELAENTWSHDNYGTFNTAVSSRSNWATFSFWLLEVLAIEGEPGFNDLKVKGMYRGWRNLMTYGWFQSGATFEGEAKNQLGMDGIIPFAKRMDMYGFDNLGAHPYLQAYVQKFLPQSIIPTQDGFIKYDLLGGCHSKGGSANLSDLLGMKYMFPKDAVVDFIYHTSMHDDYANVPDRPDGYFNALLFYAIFATDFEVNNSTASDLKMPKTFFCGERALMMTRSSWDTKDALMLNMHTRQANGGHPYSDRNAIMLAGAGRVWSPTQYNAFENSKHSLLSIDGMKQDEHSPGKMVAFKDTAMATFCAGDAKYAWDWNNKEQEKPGGKGYYTAADVQAGKVEMPKKGKWELEPNTVNDFNFSKLPYDYLNVPRSETPHWILPVGAVRPFLREVNYPVAKAFRTAGIVRSENHPFALIIDDMAKDDAIHHYDWVLTLEYDIQLVKTTKTNDHEMDIILTGDDPEQNESWGKDTLQAMYSGKLSKNQPMLLVRVLNMDNNKPENVPYLSEWRKTDPKAKEIPVRKLTIPADAVDAKLKVLLFPYRNGEEIPTTSWNSKHDKVTVKWKNGKKQEINFKENPDGRTRFMIESEKDVFNF